MTQPTQRYRISQGSALHISQQGEEHLYYNQSIEIDATPEALRAFYYMMFNNDVNSICNCDDSLGVKGADLYERTDSHKGEW